MVTITLKNKYEFKKKLAEKGYSMVDFSEKIGISNAYLSTIVSQKKHLSAPLAKKISIELDIDITDIFFIE